jgi:uncharacterized damage-inducible protein DinB
MERNCSSCDRSEAVLPQRSNTKRLGDFPSTCRTINMVWMSELEKIVDQHERAFEGDAWHGDPLMRILEGVTATQAAAHPVNDGHSIWELVNHLRAWRAAIPVRLRGEVKELTGAEDWPPVTDTSEEAWRNCVQDLRDRTESYLTAVRAFPEKKLSENVPNRDHSFYVLLHGMVQHDLYHAGQIALLKKAAG